MTVVSVSTKGDRDLRLKFDTFPERAHQALEERIRSITEALEQRIEAAAPVLTGKLRSEIEPDVYADQPTRVAGYVAVRAPGDPNEYAKAATMEYGTDKPRRAFERVTGLMARFSASRRRIIDRLSKPVHIAAFRYLRDPFEVMEPEIVQQLQDALAEAGAPDLG